MIVIAAALLLLAVLVIERRIARPILILERAMTGRALRRRAPPMQLSAPSELQRLSRAFQELVRDASVELEQRERAEAAARSAESDAQAAGVSYRLLFERHPLPMWIYEPSSLAIIEVNLAAISKYGYSREEFRSMTIGELRPSEDVPGMLASVAASPDQDRSGPWRHVTRDGDTVEVEIISHAIEYQGRGCRLVTAIDVTERERVQRQLSQTQRLESLGKLAGGVAHDFNNLLGVIINFAAFVAEQISEEPSTAARDAALEDLSQIDRAAHQATRLTRQLLAFARREVIRPEVIDLNDIVRETEALLRRTLGEHVELTCTLATELAPILADPGQIEQVLVNLAVNARDAMPDGGTLLIETAGVEVDQDYADARPGLVPGPYVRLRVSDTGEGMSPEVIDRAFEPFFTTKPQGQGTGLGLATIYGVVTQLGGRVSLYSELGIGTTCSVMIPATSRASARRNESGEERARSGRGELILLVEDEDGIREVARRILERSGYSVHAASNGPEAIELAAALPQVDLLLTDAVMPGMFGRDLAERITRSSPSTRVLFMSGYATPMLGAGGTLPAGVRLIEKPFTEQTLLARVHEALAADSRIEER